MPGPAPKPSATRQRRNRTTTAAQLPSEASAADNEVPPLPPRAEGAEPWHPMVVEWWESVWRSPMAAEFLDADMRGGLYLLADLHQLRWTALTGGALIEVAKEIRLQEVRFGLSPIDRRRLQWEVDKGEKAAARTENRRQKTPKKSKAAKDPRSVLKVV